jgi:hypothetical protein
MSDARLLWRVLDMFLAAVKASLGGPAWLSLLSAVVFIM